MQYDENIDDTFSDVQRAFNKIGRVVETSPSIKSITGKTRYGLQSVKLRVSIVSNGADNSIVDVQAFGDDIWGGGARKGTEKLLRALDALKQSG